jgi:hypothetical protein
MCIMVGIGSITDIFSLSYRRLELALIAVMRKDFKQASHFVRRSYDRFLSVWSNLHPLSEKPRLHELANLQRVSIIVVEEAALVCTRCLFTDTFLCHFLYQDCRIGRIFRESQCCHARLYGRLVDASFVKVEQEIS